MRTMTIAAVAFAFTLTAGAAAQESIALVGADLIDGSGGPVIGNGVLIVEGERIACVGPAEQCAIPADARRIDLDGRFVTPGLVDAHVHFAQTGWLDGRPDGVEAPGVYAYDETIAALRDDPGRWHRAYLCSGITAVFDVGGQRWTVTDPHATDTDRRDRVHVRAAGPLITHASERNRFFVRGEATQPLFLPMGSDDQVRDGVRRLQEMGAAAVKVWFLAPAPERQAELDARLSLVGELAREAGLPLIVHATELRGAKQALRAGAKMLVHSVEDQLVDQEFLTLLLDNGAAYAPTLIVGSGWARALASVRFGAPLAVDDPNRCVDEGVLDRIAHPERLKDAFNTRFGNRYDANRMMARLEGEGITAAVMAANLRAVAEAGGHIVVGTDAGNPLTVHGPSIYREMEAMQAAGLSPGEVIVAATSAGARLMGRDGAFGTLERGKLADLIVLAEDPRQDVAHFRGLSHVMRAGVLRSQAELQVR